MRSRILKGIKSSSALLNRGLDEKTADELKVTLLQSLAKNAKFYGNHLNEQQIGELQRGVESIQNLDVRTAAAAVRGAEPSRRSGQVLIVKEATP